MAEAHPPTENDPGPGRRDPARPGAREQRPSRAQGFIAGAVGAGVALAVATLVGALSGSGVTAVASIGTWLIEELAGPLREPAVEVFGQGNKAALLTGIVLVSLLIGGALGAVARARPWVAVAGFVAFGVLGVLAGRIDPLATDAAAIVAVLFAVPAGLATLFGLHAVARYGHPFRHLLPEPSGPSPAGATPAGATAAGATPAGATPTTATEVTGDETASTVTAWPTDATANRRAFLSWTAGASALAVAAGGAGRALAERNVVDTERDLIALPTTGTLTGSPTPDNPFGVEGLSPYVTPNDGFYKIDTALVSPRVDPRTWTLEVTGMVDRPFTLSLDDLLALPLEEHTVTLSCVSNEVGGNLVGNAVWLGYPLSALLARAGVQDGASQVVGVSVDGWTAGFPTTAALDGRTALVAVGMNGEPLPIAHGFPARLVVAGLYGYVSATKWLSEIRLTTWEGFDGYWMDKGWSKEGPVKTQSRIDVPRSGAPIPPGPTAIAGVAWAPHRGIRAVEVQVDDGPWHPAAIAPVDTDESWVQWMLTWDATPGAHTITVRATDGDGVTQTPERRRPDPDGATGWHAKGILVDDP